MKRQAFTLVELIVVITILSILGTIGFISLQGFSSDARDSKRISEIGEIRSGLQIYQARNSLVPTPSEQIVTVGSGTTDLIIQGYAGVSVLNEIRMNGEPKDPLEKEYYTYSVNASKTKFELLALLENDNNLTSFNTLNIIPTTHASYINRYPYTVGGGTVGILLDETTNTPLQKLFTSVDLNTDTNNYKVIFGNNNQTSTLSGELLYTEILNQTNNNGVVQNNEPQEPELIVGTTGTVIYDTYTYTTKVMSMKTSANEDYNAIWTTQNMRHPVTVSGIDCLTTSWTSSDTGKCSVGNQTNDTAGYNDTNTQTNLYGMYYQWSAAKEVCKLLGDGWNIATNNQFKDLERGLGCADGTGGGVDTTSTWSRCGNGYGGFDVGTYGLGYNAISTVDKRYMGGVFGTNQTALPGFRASYENFIYRGTRGSWWSTTEDGTVASNRIFSSSSSAVQLYSDNIAYGFSVVCIKN